jgi:hypothetical protein
MMVSVPGRAAAMVSMLGRAPAMVYMLGRAPAMVYMMSRGWGPMASAVSMLGQSRGADKYADGKQGDKGGL